MKRHFDIDPTQQDWAEDGHYDYDEAYDACAKAIRTRFPDAKITREEYRHTGDMMILEVTNDGDAEWAPVIEAEIDFCSLTWEPA